MPGCGSFSGATATPTITASTTTGTLIRKIEPHAKCSRSAPPTIGPSAPPTTDRLPHTLIAMLRSRSLVKATRISASVAGIIAAAPTASSPRAAISTSGVGAVAAMSEASPNTTSPTRNMRRWPNRSPRVPVPSRSPVITSG